MWNNLFVLDFPPSPSTYLIFFFLCWGFLCSVWLVTGSCLLFLFSIQLPPDICSWDVIRSIHHRNYDPWRAGQVLVTGEDVIRVVGDIVLRQAASFSTGYTILCGCVCPFTLYKGFRSGVQTVSRFSGTWKHGSNCTRVKNQDSVTNEPNVTPSWVNSDLSTLISSYFRNSRRWVVCLQRWNGGCSCPTSSVSTHCPEAQWPYSAWACSQAKAVNCLPALPHRAPFKKKQYCLFLLMAKAI